MDAQHTTTIAQTVPCAGALAETTGRVTKLDAMRPVNSNTKKQLQLLEQGSSGYGTRRMVGERGQHDNG